MLTCCSDAFNTLCYTGGFHNRGNACGGKQTCNYTTINISSVWFYDWYLWLEATKPTHKFNQRFPKSIKNLVYLLYLFISIIRTIFCLLVNEELFTTHDNSLDLFIYLRTTHINKEETSPSCKCARSVHAPPISLSLLASLHLCLCRSYHDHASPENIYCMYNIFFGDDEVIFSSTLHPSTCSLVNTLLNNSSTIWVLSNLKQDFLHVSVFSWRIDQLCDLLLQGPRQRHELDKLTLWAFVNLHAHKQE